MEDFNFGYYAASTVVKELSTLNSPITIDNVLNELENNWEPYMTTKEESIEC